MPEERVRFEPDTTELRRSSAVVGAVVGITDRVYEISGPTVTFDEVLVTGDLSGELEYNGKRLRVVRIDTIIGLELGAKGVRGPLWKGVDCTVLT